MKCSDSQIGTHRNTHLGPALIVANRTLCREHHLLTMRVRSLPPSAPGHFVHLCPPQSASDAYRQREWNDRSETTSSRGEYVMPMLRRAFSIAGRRELPDGTEIDIIFRVVGRGTRWLASLHNGDELSLLGPLGNRFPISDTKRRAWMIAGGVGLPPMLYLAEALCAAEINALAFCGAQSKGLLPFDLSDETIASIDASRATRCINEFARHGVDSIISTDDGSMGFAGHIGAALAAHARINPPDVMDLIVYTCGPERMMHFVAEYCIKHSIECYVCMERAMACGTGMCQSCVVPVHDAEAENAWRYRLCCTDGPVFSASEIIWQPATAV